MNIFKKIAIKLKLIKPKQNWFKNFFKSFRSLFSLKSKKSKFFVSAFVVLALASGFSVVYSQNGNNSDGEVSLSKGLVAHWTMDEEDYEEGTVNLVSNPKGSVLANPIPGNYQPGWDPSLHDDAVTVSGWGSGYNSGVGSSDIGYHAKWVYEGIDGGDDPCMKFIDRNDLYGLGHRWLGIAQGLGTPNSMGWSVGDVITVSWWQKSDVLNKGARVGLHHKLLSSGSYSFENSLSIVYVTNINKWELASFTVTIGSDWDLNANISYYVYAHHGAHGTLWVDNLQAEKKDHVTPFVAGERVDRVVDKSAYENHGTNYGATFTEDRFGKEGGAMNFNSSRIDIPNPINQSNLEQEWTVTAWVDIEIKDGQNLISGLNNGLSMSRSNGSLLLYLNSGANDYYVYGDGKDSLAGKGWRHVAYVFRNSDGLRKIYIDGEDHTGSGPNKTSIPRGINSLLQIGNGVNGKLDDVRIYNRALSELEIKSLHDSYSPKTTTGSLQKGLVLDMPLKLKYTKSETPGSEIMTDRTPYGNDGQNYGATITDEGARFNENLGYIKLNYSSQYNIKEEITLSVWMKRFKEKSGGDIHILSRPPSWYFYDSPSGLVGGYLYIDGASRAHLSTKIEADSNWHHILYTYDSKTKKAVIYKDGQISNEASLSGLSNYSIDSSFSNMRPIGKTTSSNDLFLSNLSVYDRALSKEEVKTLYDRGRSDAGIIFQEN